MYRKLKVRMTFPKSYPEEGLLLELSSDRLPSAVLKRMTKHADRQVGAVMSNHDYDLNFPCLNWIITHRRHVDRPRLKMSFKIQVKFFPF